MRPLAVVEQLPPTTDAPRIARDAAARLLARVHPANGRGDDLALVVSELVSNAVLHGDDDIELRLSGTPALFRVEVSDSGTTPFPWPPIPDGNRFHGLDLVRIFSDRCGIDRLPCTLAWCELDLTIQ